MKKFAFVTMFLASFFTCVPAHAGIIKKGLVVAGAVMAAKAIAKNKHEKK